MDSFEFSKIAGAVLAALLVIFGGRLLISGEGGKKDQVGYVLPAPVEAPAASKEAAAEAPGTAFDAKAVVALLAKAKAEDGAGAFKKCATCHVSEKGKASTAGPNLWGVVGRPKASQPDFTAKYSEAMKAKAGQWGYEELAAFIHKPKGYVEGTKMVFAGIPDSAELANLIAYLRTLSDSPPALPN
jgi:cytochrome c